MTNFTQLYRHIGTKTLNTDTGIRSIVKYQHEALLTIKQREISVSHV